MRARLLVHPLTLLGVPLLLCVVAWTVPPASRALTGYVEKSSLTAGALAVLVLWYSAVFLVVWIGYRLGRSVAPVAWLRNGPDGSSRWEHQACWILTAVASFGVIYSIWSAEQHIDIVDQLLNGTGNELRQSLDESAGLATLRYTPAIAAPISVFLWQARGGRGPLAVWNCAMLVVSSLFSNRISILMAIAVYLFLLVAWKPDLRVRVARTLGVVAVVFALFTVLNASRNVNFYQGQGVDNPALSNLTQMQSYLGSPMQVSVGVARLIADGNYPNRYGIARGVQVLTPSFFRSPDESDQAAENSQNLVYSSGGKPTGLQRYGGKVDIAQALTTNSVFADSLSAYGYWSLLFVLPLLGVSGWLVGHFSRYDSILAGTAGVFGYSLSEVWRTLFANGGFIIYLAVALVLSCCATRLLNDRLRRDVPVAG